MSYFGKSGFEQSLRESRGHFVIHLVPSVSVKCQAFPVDDSRPDLSDEHPSSKD